MRVPSMGRLAALGAAVILVAACGGGAAGGGDTATDAPSTGPGGDAGGLDACILISAADLQGTISFPVQPGVGDHSTGQAHCQWTGSGGVMVSLTVANYDDAAWQAVSTGTTKAVPGVGDAAFKGLPGPNDLNVKVKTYIVTVSVTIPKTDAATLDADALGVAQQVVRGL